MSCNLYFFFFSFIYKSRIVSFICQIRKIRNLKKFDRCHYCSRNSLPNGNTKVIGVRAVLSLVSMAVFVDRCLSIWSIYSVVFFALQLLPSVLRSSSFYYTSSAIKFQLLSYNMNFFLDRDASPVARQIVSLFHTNSLRRVDDVGYNLILQLNK